MAKDLPSRWWCLQQQQPVHRCARKTLVVWALQPGERCGNVQDNRAFAKFCFFRPTPFYEVTTGERIALVAGSGDHII